jgi:hypothetical protein
MANAVAFESIEKQDLIRFAYGLVVSDVPHLDPAIWEHQLRAGCTLFGVWMPAATSTIRIPNRNSRRLQQRLHIEFG